MELEVVPAFTLAVQLKAVYLEALLYGVKLSQSEYYNFFSALWLYALKYVPICTTYTLFNWLCMQVHLQYSQNNSVEYIYFHTKYNSSLVCTQYVHISYHIILSNLIILDMQYTVQSVYQST